MARGQVRVRGMNAAADLTPSPDGHHPTKGKEFPHSSVRQLLVAVAILSGGSVLAYFTYADVSARTSFVGAVQPEQTLNLDFTQTGRIQDVMVRAGEHVKKGQPLATQDQAVAKATLADAKAVLSAAQAKLTALQSPALAESTKQNLDLQVAKANSQLAGAQKAAADAVATADAEVAQAQQAVTDAQSTYDADNRQLSTLCANGSDTDKTFCANLQAQVRKDASAIATANANLVHTKASTAQLRDTAANAVTSAQSTLALTRNQRAAAGEPASAADVSSAQSAVASAQSDVDQAQHALDQLTLTSPIDGVIANVGGVPGELDGTTGVHGFAGPQSMQPAQAPAFSLFPPAAGADSTANPGTANQHPLITLVSSESDAVAQVAEAAMPGLKQGTPARVTVNALRRTVDGTVDQVIPMPIDQSGSVEYAVRLTVAHWPEGTTPGMSLSVVFP
ncbi:HlyD family secretion protein [Kutzneria kofuensis]|uniref:Multidrug efflux pump subunit AcrA (Membrane-fusion protein) n=1 Tax=Kutzneria kofuensis TaxID=103725 RepID=A0A7W9KNQ7_9PSEU|nr:HlyD family efflux transporter periplasmic adaptor subunit [Kutzneria kofuensis]MBB5895922.1 multidrug efflux pump subunit AcrA (membrane-fusion protein) [Kutzneria kofuensis]